MLARPRDGLADDGDDEIVVLEQPLGDALGVVERDGGDEAVALLDIVGAEVVLEEAEELARDLGVGIEAQRIGADQILLGVLELVGLRAVLGDLSSARRG